MAILNLDLVHLALKHAYKKVSSGGAFIFFSIFKGWEGEYAIFVSFGVSLKGEK